MFSAQQHGQQIMGRGVIADQLRRSLFSGHEHVDGCRVVALLRIGTGKIGYLAPSAAKEAGRRWRSSLSPAATAVLASPNTTAAETSWIRTFVGPNAVQWSLRSAASRSATHRAAERDRSAAARSNSAAAASWERDWELLTGWKRWLLVAGAIHAYFTDLALMADQVGIGTGAALPGAKVKRASNARDGELFWPLFSLPGDPDVLMKSAAESDTMWLAEQFRITEDALKGLLERLRGREPHNWVSGVWASSMLNGKQA